jgi:hypothetical protein
VPALLHKKYRDLKVDVVVTVDEFAPDLAERYDAELWPGAAIVFMSVSSNVLRGRSLGPQLPGPDRKLGERTLEYQYESVPSTARASFSAS